MYTMYLWTIFILQKTFSGVVCMLIICIISNNKRVLFLIIKSIKNVNRCVQYSLLFNLQ